MLVSRNRPLPPRMLRNDAEVVFRLDSDGAVVCALIVLLVASSYDRSTAVCLNMVLTSPFAATPSRLVAAVNGGADYIDGAKRSVGVTLADIDTARAVVAQLSKRLV